MSKIFISYRREDSEAITGRIYDRLTAHFGPANLFMDVDTMPLGVDFVEYLNDMVGRCDILVAVIGDRWLDARHSEGPLQGQRRLEDPRDFVRAEIQTALARNITVIPVLVGKTTMPAEQQLPPELAKLSYRNAAEVSSGRDFHDHMSRLIKGIDDHLQKRREADEAESRRRQEEADREQREDDARRQAEKKRLQAQKNDADQLRQENLRLQREVETSFADLVRNAFERTEGSPTLEDQDAAKAFCKRHDLAQKRAQDLVHEVREQWRKAQQAADACFARGFAFQEKDEHDKAIAEYTEGLRLKPRFAVAYCNRGLAYYKTGEHKKAIADCTESLNLDPNATTLLNRGLAYRKLSEYDKALADFNEAIRLNPQDAASYYNRGLTFKLRREYDKAIADFTAAIRLNPRWFECYEERGKTYNLQGEYDKAIADLSETLRLAPDHAMAYYTRGTLSVGSEPDRAIADLNEFIRLSPDSAQGYASRGGAYYAKKEYAKAIADYTEAIRLDPRAANVYGLRALVYRKMGDAAKARRDEDKARELTDPASAHDPPEAT